MQIDYREHKILKDFPDAEVCNLEVGDIVDGDLCIERKTEEDFVNSIIDGRIFNQSLNMKNNYRMSFILIASDLERINKYLYFTNRKISIDVIKGAVARIIITYKIPIIFCSTKNNLIEITNLIIEKAKDGSSPEFIIKQINKTKVNPKILVLLSIPRIGQKKAKKIIEHYKLFSNIKHMERPPGISEKDINNILRILE